MRICPKCCTNYDDNKLTIYKTCIKCNVAIVDVSDGELRDKKEKKKHNELEKAKNELRTIVCKKCSRENIVQGKPIGGIIPSFTVVTNCENCGTYLFGNPKRNLFLGILETVFMGLVFIKTLPYWLTEEQKLFGLPIGVISLVFLIAFLDGVKRTIHAYRNIINEKQGQRSFLQNK